MSCNPTGATQPLEWNTCKTATVTVSAIVVALSIIAVTGLILTNQASYYAYAAGGAGVLGLGALAISLCKGCSHIGRVVPMIPVERHEEFQTLESGAVLKTVRLTTNAFDMADFVRWVDAHWKSSQKSKLLESTLFTHEPLPQTLEITYHQLYMSQDEFAQKLNAPLNEINTAFHEGWYAYTDQGHLHIDFANAYSFGGGWRVEGNVQEETLFCEFFKLALLAYLSAATGEMIRPATGSPEQENADATPFIVENVERQYRVDPALYGNGIYEVNAREIPGYVTPQENTSVVFGGIAARRWSSQGTYSRNDLLYHLKAAYLAFIGEKLLNEADARAHTGPWGCGVFHNSPKMLTGIQLLAARMAGVDINFWGVDADAELVAQVNRFENAEEGIQYFLDQQESDPSWKPYARQTRV